MQNKQIMRKKKPKCKMRRKIKRINVCLIIHNFYYYDFDLSLLTMFKINCLNDY